MLLTITYFDNISTDATTASFIDTTSVFDNYDFYIHPHWKQFGKVPDHWHYLIGIYITIVGITGIIGNSIVIWIFSTTKNLKTPSNMLIINLALSDLVFSLVNGFPLLTISAFNKKWMWGNAACQFYGFIGGLFGCMSINTLSAISIDRYINIAYPLTSVVFMTRKKSFMMILCVWIWSLVWAVPPIFGWGAYIPEGFQTSCTFDYLSREPHMRSYIISLYIAGFALPLCIIVVCYVLILQAIRNHDKEMIIMAKKLKADDIRANQEKTGAEIRIAKIAMGIILLFILSWSPYATVALIGQFGPREWVTPLVSELPVMLAKACAMYNPIVYAFSHPKFKEALQKRLPCVGQCCYANQRQNKPEKSSIPRNTIKRYVSRVTSADTNEPIGSLSDESSCISHIDDSLCAQPCQRNRAVSETIPNGDYNDIVLELVRALVGVASRQQFLQPVYMSNLSTSGENNQAFSDSNMSSYLSQLVSRSSTSGEMHDHPGNVAETPLDESFYLLKDDSKTELVESTVV